MWSRKAASIHKALLALILAAGCANVPLPEGFAGAVARDTDNNGLADLWLIYKGHALKAACADTDGDGTYDIVLKEDGGGLRLSIESLPGTVPSFEGHLQVATTDDFRRYSPDIMFRPFAARPRYASLLEFETRLGRNRSLELINSRDWAKISLDADGDLFRELVVSKEKGGLKRIDYYTPNSQEPSIWVGYKNNEPAVLGWRDAKALVVWDCKEDVFSIDTDGDGKLDRVVSASAPPSPDDKAYSLILDSFTEAVSKLVWAR